MLVVMRQNAPQKDIDAVVRLVDSMGLKAHPMPGAARTAIGITGNDGALSPEQFLELPSVQQAISVSQPFKLVSAEVKSGKSIVDVGGVPIGGPGFAVIAGPCSVESETQILDCARHAKACGVPLLRGGAFKPRTSPYDFQGLKQEGLDLLAKARAETGLRVVTEITRLDTLPNVVESADLLQVGARNMQNFPLLEALGEQRKPVLLKRGMSATIKELLMAAEYIAARGNDQIILCERGIRTFEPMTRNTLDLGAVTVLKELTHLPIVVDPSHGIGRRSGVIPLALAAAAVGADGVIVEFHPEPAAALSDGHQALTFDMLEDMVTALARVTAAIGRDMLHVDA